MVRRATVATTAAPLAAVIPPPPSVDVCAVAGGGTDYSNRQDLHDVNFHSYRPGSLRGAKFDNSDLRGASFAGVDLTGASFKGATLGASAKGPAVFTHTTLDRTCFRDASLNDAQFEFATIHCADFSNTRMIDAQFGPRQQLDHATDCRTRFIGATLDVHAITRDHWSFTDFTNAVFTNFAPSNFSLAGLPLTGAMLAGTVLPGVDMTAANLTAADLSGANLVNAVLDDATLNGARLVNTNLTGARLRCARFRGLRGDASENPNPACQSNPPSSMPLAAADMSNVQLGGSHLEFATLNNALLRGAILDRAIATHASFINASLVADHDYSSASLLGAVLSQAKFSNAHIEQVRFAGTILDGADFSSTTLQGTSFANAIAPGAQFTKASMEGVDFTNAILQSASFVDSVIQTGPNSGETIFTCANMGGSDFTGADVKQARFTAAVMPGAEDCCAALDTPKCGIIDFTQVVYGPTKYPALTADNDKVYCPNGHHSPCDAAAWKVPGWKTDLCNVPISDRTPRVVWSPPDCGAAPADVIQFDDQNLHACVSDAFPGKPAEITKSMARRLTELHCPGRSIGRLGGLAAFTGLAVLDLSGNQLQQFTVDLPRLRDLMIASNQLTTLDVTDMADLSRLNASNNHLQSVTGLGIVSPIVLDLSQNQLGAIDLPIQNRLSYANLSSNQLTSVLDPSNGDLSGASSLVYLDVSGNSLTTIGALQKAPSLSSLLLGCNPVFDCSTLGADPSSPVMQNSQCAALRKQDNVWVLRPHPRCQ
jgi:uncharacterized protein YjbI with pentapeptide repeats